MIAILYLLYNVIRTFFSEYPFYGLDLLIYLIPAIILFIILSQIQINKSERTLIVNAFVFGFILSIIPGYFLQSHNVDFSRLSLNWANPNYYASYLLIHISLFAYLWRVSSGKKEKNYFKRYSFLSLFILSILFLLWTQSRGGLLAFIIMLTILILIYSIRKSKFKLLIILVILILILFIGLYHTFQSIRPTTIIFRERIYKSTFEYIKDFWLSGSGVETFAHYFPKYRLSDYKLIGQEDIITHTHNEFLEQWAETGFIGLLLFIAFIVIIVRYGLKNIKRLKGEKRYFIIACMISFLLFIIHNLFTITMRIYPLQIYFYIFAGLICANYEETKTEINQSNKKKYILIIIIPLFLWIISVSIKNIEGLYYFQKSKDEFSTSKVGLSTSIGYAEKAFKYIPHNTSLLYHLGYSYNFKKDYKKAIEYFNYLLEISPYYPQAHFWKGYIYSLSNNWNKAIDEYKAEIKYDQYPKVFFNLAIAYYYINNEELCMNYFKIYLEKVVEKLEKNLVLDSTTILSQEKRSIDFAFEKLEDYYINKDKNMISELEEIKKILMP
ncbi:MAG: O-antigen ligase family protein [Candidatus Cloacimonetes bacterium]|nr:O-antigen ligase family protein [Candidatus Cloacimonadota bacterium]